MQTAQQYVILNTCFLILTIYQDEQNKVLKAMIVSQQVYTKFSLSLSPLLSFTHTPLFCFANIAQTEKIPETGEQTT